MRRSFKPISIEPLLPAVVATKSSLPQTSSGSGRLGRTVLTRACASIALTTVYPRVPSTGRPAYRADRFVTPDSGPWMPVQGRTATVARRNSGHSTSPHVNVSPNGRFYG